MDAVKEKMIAELLGPGGEFELGLDTWECGHKPVTGVCFKRGPRTIKEYVEMTIPAHEDKEFIVFQDERYTFGQVRKLIQSFGDALHEDYQINKGDRVALCMRNYPEWVVTFFAVTCIGAVVVPLNGWWKTDELKYGLEDCGAKLLVCDQERFNRVEEVLDQLNMQVVLVRPSKEVPAPLENTVKEFQQVVAKRIPVDSAVTGVDWMKSHSHDHDDVAAIFYTSGTTGHPKGVSQTHRGITNQMIVSMVADRLTSAEKRNGEGTNEEKQTADCAICPVPLFHVTASHHIMLSSLITGRKLVLMYKWDPEEALKLIHKEKPTAWTGVPTMVADMMAHPKFHEYDTSSLKSVGGGGAPTPTKQVNTVREKFKGGQPSNGYGLTETNGAVSLINGDEYVDRPTSCGKPFPVVSVCIVDPDDTSGTPLPPGQRGELLVKSPLVMSHYWNKPDKTGEAIITLPEPYGHGWFRTGDIAEVDADGFIHILDRAKDIVIRGGENISCSEVESAAFEFAGVLECAAFGVKDDRLGETMGLVVVPKPGVEDMDLNALRSVLSQRLANYKVPKPEHMFVWNEPLPRGATGKILKRTIRDAVNRALEGNAKL